MTGLFDFNKPKTPTQWLIFLAASAIVLSNPIGTRKFISELKKNIRDKDSNIKSKQLDSLSQAVYRLKKRRIIKFRKEGDKVVMVLTEKGIKRKLQYDIDTIRLCKPSVWDGKWRMLMFDIPEPKKAMREILRLNLKSLGFLQFQKSVWICPYSCQDEIDFLTEYFRIPQYVNLFTVGIENDEPLRQKFKL